MPMNSEITKWKFYATSHEVSLNFWFCFLINKDLRKIAVKVLRSSSI